MPLRRQVVSASTSTLVAAWFALVSSSRVTTDRRLEGTQNHSPLLACRRARSRRSCEAPHRAGGHGRRGHEIAARPEMRAERAEYEREMRSEYATEMRDEYAAEMR